MTITSPFHAHSRATEVIAGHNLTGKTALVIDRRRFVVFSVAFIALFTLTYDFRLVYLKNPRLRQFPHPGRSLPEHPLEFDRPVWGTSTRQAE